MVSGPQNCPLQLSGLLSVLSRYDLTPVCLKGAVLHLLEAYPF